MIVTSMLRGYVVYVELDHPHLGIVGSSNSEAGKVPFSFKFLPRLIGVHGPYVLIEGNFSHT